MGYNLDPNQFRQAIAPTEWAAKNLASSCSVPVHKNFLIDAAILIGLISVGVAGYWYSPLLLPKTDVTAQPDPGCDLHRQACGASVPGGGRIELEIAPHPIPMLQPLAVKVHVSGIDAKSAEIDFAGVGMNMGFNRPTLAAAAPGLFTGNASLPVCVSGTMSWQATVLIETGRSRISVPFRFDSKTH